MNAAAVVVAAATVVVVVHVVVCVISSYYYLLIANVVVVIAVAVTAVVASFAIFKCYYCSFRTFVVDAAADCVVFAILVELIIQSYLFLPLLSQEELGIIPKALLLEIYSRFKFHFVYHATAILNFFGLSKHLLSS